MIRAGTKSRVIRRRTYFRVALPLLGLFSLGLVLLIGFGRTGFGLIGIVACLICFVVAMGLSVRTVVSDYRYFVRTSNTKGLREVAFCVDIVAYVTLMLGLVVRVAGYSYGSTYVQMGIVLLWLAGMISVADQIWLYVEFRRRGDWMMLVAFCFAWISLVFGIALMLQPNSFWNVQG